MADPAPNPPNPSPAAPPAGGSGAPPTAPAPSAVPDKPWYASWIKADGGLDHAALDHLPESFKGAKDTLARYGKFDDLITAFDHQRKAISQKGLLPLRPEATEAEKAAHKAQVRAYYGIPDTPEGYKLTRPADIPEDRWSQEFLDAMTKVMHDNDVPPQTARALFDAWNQFQADAFTALEDSQNQQAAERLAESNAKLDQAWGVRRPAMEQMAVRGAVAVGLDPDSPAFKDSPETIIAMANVAKMLGEDRLPRPDGGPGGGADAAAEMAQMKSDPSHPLHAALKAILSGQYHPRADEARRRWDYLNTQIARQREAAATR